MADYRFVDASSDAVDLVVDAEFQLPLPPTKFQAILQTVADSLSLGAKLAIFFEGLSAFQVTEKKIEINFRFSKISGDTNDLNDKDRDWLSRTRVHFVLYLFAMIDKFHTLGSVPFPPNFRDFIDFTGS